MSTNVIDNDIRKWFGVGKIAQRKNSFTKYGVWIKISILLIFAIVFFRIGIESPYIYIAILLFGVIYYGFEAILEKKYSKNSKEYLVTFLIGLLKALLLMIATVIYHSLPL